jgi:hypothetical protein
MLAPDSVYLSTRGQSPSDKNSPAPLKLETYDGKNEWKPYIIKINLIAKKYNWS